MTRSIRWKRTQEDGTQGINKVRLNHVTTMEKTEGKKVRKKAKIKSKDTVEVVKDNNTEKYTEEDNVICLHHIVTTTTHQVKSIVRCPQINRYTQKISPNHMLLDPRSL